MNSTLADLKDTKKCEDSNDLSQDIARFILTAGVVPVAVLGVLGNLLALAVWHAYKSDHVTTFLFKALAVWDIVFLASFSFVIVAEGGVHRKVILAFAHVTGLAQLSSVHVTLLIGFNRWLAVFRPYDVNVLLTPRRVRVTVVATFAWCVVLQSLDVAWTLSDDLDKLVKAAMFFTKQTVGFILPMLLLIALNVFLIVTINRNVTTDTQSQQKRRATLLVVSMSVCSLIAYPVGIFLQMLLEPDTASNSSCTRLCDLTCFHIANNTFYLLQALNSSLNVVFYSLFSFGFRVLVFNLFVKCQNCQSRRRLSSVPRSPVGNTPPCMS